VKISVAMCVYEGSRFLPDQLRSIAAQTRPPDECIFCDDHSLDESVQYLVKFAEGVPFSCTIERNSVNLGTTKNFEKAISLCSHEIVVLADQDDVWKPDKLRRIEEMFLASEETAAVFSDGDLIDFESRPLAGTLWRSFGLNRAQQRQFAAGGGMKVILKHPVVTGSTLAFRRKFCDLLLPIPSIQVHDYWISLLLAACADMRPMAQRLIQYRRHSGQQIGPGKLKLLEQFAVARATGPEFYRLEIERLRLVRERLAEQSRTFPVKDEILNLIDRKIAHRNLRANLPRTPGLRYPAIIREALRGNYRDYSEGWKSVAKDLAG
jgi:glycosyltransferase involved in cell wall biosynthesis